MRVDSLIFFIGYRSSEYIQLLKHLLSSEATLKYFFEYEQGYHLTEWLCSLIDWETVRLVHEGNEEDIDKWNFSLGCALKWLMECLSLCLEEDQFQVKWKSLFLSLLNGYLSLKTFSNYPSQTATIVNDHIRDNTAIVTVFDCKAPWYMAPYYDCISPYRFAMKYDHLRAEGNGCWSSS